MHTIGRDDASTSTTAIALCLTAPVPWSMTPHQIAAFKQLCFLQMADAGPHALLPEVMDALLELASRPWWEHGSITRSRCCRSSPSKPASTTPTPSAPPPCGYLEDCCGEPHQPTVEQGKAIVRERFGAQVLESVSRSPTTRRRSSMPPTSRTAPGWWETGLEQSHASARNEVIDIRIIVMSNSVNQLTLDVGLSQLGA